MARPATFSGAVKCGSYWNIVIDNYVEEDTARTEELQSTMGAVIGLKVALKRLKAGVRMVMSLPTPSTL